MLHLSLLGPFVATFDDGPALHFPTQRSQALLVYLAVQAERPHRREALMNLLWPDIAPASAQQSLRQAMHLLRQTLTAADAAPPLLSDRQTVQLNPAFPLVLDVARFLALAHSPEPAGWQGAIDLFRGDFLAEFYLPDSEPFEEWASARRAHFRQMALDICDKLAGHRLQQADFAVAETTARRAIAIDNLHESAHRQLMMAMAMSGRRQEALMHYEALRQILRKELDIEPSAETGVLHLAIRAGELAPLSASSPPPAPHIPPPHNLPTQPTPFVGRQTEVVALSTLLADPDARMITILGPGGMGKTRLALAVGEAQLADEGGVRRFPHGVFFVELAPLSDDSHIPSVVARALDFPLRGGAGERTLQQQVLDYLRDKHLLLILDNFEHLLAGADLVSQYLSAAPAAKILVTSRERLHLRQEHVYTLAGLDLPGEAEAVETFAAAQLFVQAAHRARPDFRLDAADQRRLVRLCRQVAGMPLALELAAAWVDTLSIANIVAEIGRSLDFLATDLRDIPDRHRSLRAAFDTSWQFLTADEQAVFAALSVFRGGFSREAAQAVAMADSAPLSLRLLSRLAGKSLIQPDAARSRYTVHELLRQYAADHLTHPAAATDPDAFAVRDRHAGYFLDLLHQLTPGLKGAPQDEALDRVEDDLENMLLAWHWGVLNDWHDRLLLSMDSLGIFMQLRGRHQDGLRTLATISERWTDATMPDANALMLVSRSLAWQAVFSADSEDAMHRLERALKLLSDDRLADHDVATHQAFVQLQFTRALSARAPAQAQTHAAQSLHLYRQIGEVWGIAWALLQVGWCHFWLGDYASAKQSFSETLALTEQPVAGQDADQPQTSGLPWARLRSLQSLFSVAMMQGDLVAAENTTMAALALLPDSDKPGVRLERLSTEAYYLHNAGQFERAAALLDQLLRVNQGLGRQRDLFESSHTEVAMTHLHLGDYAAAQAHIESALTYMRQHSATNHSRIGFCWHVLAMLALARDDFAEAERLLIQASDIYSKHATKVDLAGALAYLSLALHGLDDNASAWHCLRDSLEISIAARAFLPLSEALVATALLLAEDEELQRAAEIYALVTRHPFVRNSRFFDDIAGQNIRCLTAVLPADLRAEAQRRAQAQDLWERASSLLAEMRAIPASS